MCKSLSSYPKEIRGKIATKRITSKTGGLGFWAAMDYLEAMERKNKENKKEVK